MRRASFCWASHFAQALSRYTKLTRAFPGQVVVWFEYGTTAARLGQLEGASRAWEKAMQLAPRNAELIVQIGHQYQGLRKPEPARACTVTQNAMIPTAMLDRTR